MPPKTKSGGTAVKTALDGIKEMLFTNALLPGQKISYRQLAEELGLSLTPVIQALKHLEFQGLVRHEPHKGYSTEPMSIQEVQDIYDTRELIETALVPDIIHNLDAEGIHTIKALLDLPRVARDAVNQRLMRDREFHLTLARLSRRRVQVQILNQLFDLLYLKYRGSLLFVESESPVGSQHRDIFDALISRDTARAQAAMKTHFTKIRSQALQALAKLLAE